MTNLSNIFSITSESEFERFALETFRFQYRLNPVYRRFCMNLGKSDSNVTQLLEIPFLPISFFKSDEIISGEKNPQTIFTSSGTTGGQVSKHFINDIGLYEQSFEKAFAHFYGDITEFCVLALLPSYLERQGSSLVYMVKNLIQKSNHSSSGFYLYEFDTLQEKLTLLEAQGQKTLLIGVSFALCDFAEKHAMALRRTIIMETGGMKGRRKELIRKELHRILKNGFGVSTVHSEYGMTELLSQAYSKGDGIFRTPSWMRVFVRDTEDPLTFQNAGKTGGLNIIDLANRNSCSFIATQDLGKTHSDGSFEVLGRFDNSDVRGCNLMVL